MIFKRILSFQIRDPESVYQRHRVSWPFLQGSLCDLFTYNVCSTATRVTQLVLAELCNTLWAGHQHVVHVWQTHTHLSPSSVHVWLTQTVTLEESRVNAELRSNKESMENPLFTWRSCFSNQQQISVCLVLPVMDLTPRLNLHHRLTS